MFGRRNCKEASGFWLSSWMQRDRIAVQRASNAVSRGDLDLFLESWVQSIFAAFMWRSQVGSGLFRTQRGLRGGWGSPSCCGQG